MSCGGCRQVFQPLNSFSVVQSTGLGSTEGVIKASDLVARGIVPKNKGEVVTPPLTEEKPVAGISGPASNDSNE